MLVGFHQKSIDACLWVIKNAGHNTSNITVNQWVQDCMDYLSENMMLVAVDSLYPGHKFFVDHCNHENSQLLKLTCITDPELVVEDYIAASKIRLL